ncbi:hypothetical protein B0H14DRAFT_3486828 [Mycena olivaceomarginata]|nr:hypothetical protein B0H14DRAFT_3486828 [Mycena olivaceomarginata]
MPHIYQHPGNFLNAVNHLAIAATLKNNPTIAGRKTLQFFIDHILLLHKEASNAAARACGWTKDSGSVRHSQQKAERTDNQHFQITVGWCDLPNGETSRRQLWTYDVSKADKHVLPPGFDLNRHVNHGQKTIPIDDGGKILLTRGWVDNTEPFNLSGDTTILFHTENYTIESASGTTGNFPSGIRWHLVGSIAGPHLSPSVVIAAWVIHNDMDGVLVPEIWQYFLPPVGWIRCLNLRETFWDLKLDFQSFVTAGTRMLLFGSEEGHDDEAEVQEDIERRLPRWDVAIEISGPSERGSTPPPGSTAAGQDNKELNDPRKRKGAAKPAATPKAPAAAKPKGKVSDAAANAGSAKAKAPISRKSGSVAASASRSRSTSVMPGGSVGPDSSEKHDGGDQDVLSAAAGGDKLYCVCKTTYDEG